MAKKDVLEGFLSDMEMEDKKKNKPKIRDYVIEDSADRKLAGVVE